MYNKLYDVLNGKEDNYIIPFYWQQGNHYGEIAEQIEEILASGARAFCVESRVHPDFGGESWWRDLRKILEEAKKRDMKVWILDDKSFPTGRANEKIRDLYPERRPWRLTERHVDVIGPTSEMTLLFDEDEENVLIGAYAYRRVDGSETLSKESVDVTKKCKKPYFRWNVPEGVWRVFFLYKSRKGDCPNQDNYIDMVNTCSTDVLIEAVYEEHYKNLKEYFGNTLVGFFSDEPGLNNCWFGSHTEDKGMYNKRVGMEGLALPWSDEVESLMQKELQCKVLCFLPSLWYEMESVTAQVRYAYMNAVTLLYKKNFSKKIGDWCRKHGVMHIGHIIEDMNTDSRLGVGCGHFFRAMDYQDMSGMDIVLHQVIPGLGQYIHTSSTFGGKADPEFFQYLLPKLCSSQAKINKEMQGRAMCEIFGAYGWAESVSTMKWLIDFLLVRGINHFVPHAFSPFFPNWDCPPHFGCNGRDPQFEGFTKLMDYTNKISHLFYGAKRVSDVGVLYAAEAEWMNKDGDYMLTQKPAKVLYDEHIDFDVIPADYLGSIDGLEYKYIVVPFARKLPTKVINGLQQMGKQRQIIFVDEYPDGVNFGKKVKLIDLATVIPRDMVVCGDFPLLRCQHAISDDIDLYMFFNESVRDCVSTSISLGVKGGYVVLDLINDTIKSGYTEDGNIKLNLSPYQSCVVIFDEMYGFKKERQMIEIGEISSKFRVEIAQTSNLREFEVYKEIVNPININGEDELPDFAGKIRYVGCFDVPEDGEYVIKWENVGEMIHLWLNGEDYGLRICQPFCFDILCKKGKNEILFEISTTLAYKLKDHFSYWMQLNPTGYLGKITLYKYL